MNILIITKTTIKYKKPGKKTIFIIDNRANKIGNISIINTIHPHPLSKDFKKLKIFMFFYYYFIKLQLQGAESSFINN